MIVVLFEVKLSANMKEVYLKMAENLYTELKKEKGFISLERFQSIQNPDTLISVQLWEDEQAIERWRNNMQHRKVMDVGYHKIFDHYTLRVLQQIRAYSKDAREQAPKDVSFQKPADE